MAKSLVSIIIPTYNRAHLIAETLDSIIAQTFTDWECIIVDDGSTDTTKAIVEAYLDKDQRFKFVTRPKHLPQGGNAARNYGFSISKGQLINWFDSDDIMLPHFLESRLSFFKDPNVNLVFCSATIINHEKKDIGKLQLDLKTDLFRAYMHWEFQVITNSVLFRKNYLLTKTLFNEQIVRGQEHEFFSRLFFELNKTQYKIVNVPLFLYRQHQGTKTTLNETYIPEYKTSLAFIYTQNLEKIIQLEDGTLIKFFFSLIMNIYFDAFKYKHPKVRVYITKRLSSILLRYHFSLIDVVLILQVMTLFNLQSYRLYKYAIKRVSNYAITN
ncbi:glycosyltransferase family 2 protein [Mesoflavibacter zeaxanthinifaciens]|uniref:glycosyltransferase family 2 protein n=1 Tax=Mesoflavibacter zeaxanthinifaciens TaxID=393060 RepID=UPI0003FC2F3D|nr:glycosyltransferase family 2 protein [Mesoflavibacter zeaxanthinifaciens]